MREEERVEREVGKNGESMAREGGKGKEGEKRQKEVMERQDLMLQTNQGQKTIGARSLT